MREYREGYERISGEIIIMLKNKNITETKKIIDVFNYVDSETLVLFDVDNTLIEPTSYIGSSTWFSYIVKKTLDRGMEFKEVIDRLIPIFVELQHIISVKPVEAQTAMVVKKLHKQNIKTMGLTARNFILSKRTDEQLRYVDISLDSNTIYDGEIIFSEEVGFYRGVLSIEPFGNKGARLFQLFEKINYWPKKVVFVDDTREFLDGVSDMLAEQNIDFTGLRYGATDGQITAFDPARADQELVQAFEGAGRQSLIEDIRKFYEI
jgi:phosphoserine phosphatase